MFSDTTTAPECQARRGRHHRSLPLPSTLSLCCSGRERLIRQYEFQQEGRGRCGHPQGRPHECISRRSAERQNCQIITPNVNKCTTTARVFNTSPVSPRKCRILLTKIALLLFTGEKFPTNEATSLFFGISKLFQNKDASLRQMVYLVIKELAQTAEDVIMVTSSIMKDTAAVGSDAIYRANAIRSLCRIIDVRMLYLNREDFVLTVHDTGLNSASNRTQHQNSHCGQATLRLFCCTGLIIPPTSNRSRHCTTMAIRDTRGRLFPEVLRRFHEFRWQRTTHGCRWNKLHDSISCHWTALSNAKSRSYGVGEDGATVLCRRSREEPSGESDVGTSSCEAGRGGSRTTKTDDEASGRMASRQERNGQLRSGQGNLQHA